jgi:hypothetical protein
MKKRLLSKIQKNKTTFTQKKQAYLQIQIKKAAQENKGLLEIARQYITHANVDFETASPIQALCNYHNTNPMALRSLGRNSAEYLVRKLHNDPTPVTVPEYINYREIDLENTIKSFKLLNLASNLEELVGDRTRQDFYNQSKLQGLINTAEDKKLFYNITDNLTGTNRYFGHSYIDENQDLSPLSEVIGTSRVLK